MEMEGNGGGHRLVVTELSHIKELVMQLEAHLGGSPDLCKHLASQIVTLTERSIGLIASAASRKRSSSPLTDSGLASVAPSSLRDAGNMPFKATKRRETMAAEKHQVRMSSAGSPVDDGHRWRKYGQKEILGAKHPRGYYRCTHRRSQGCVATKQVQRTDEDATLFDVIYHGKHTCVADEASAAAKQPTEHSQDAQSLLQSLGSSLTVKTEGLAEAAEPQVWSATTPFSFPSTPASGCPAPVGSPFSAPSTLLDWGVSPATSGSNLAASYPPVEEVDTPEDFLDIDIDIDILSFFA